jgi:hypothetical protein
MKALNQYAFAPRHAGYGLRVIDSGGERDSSDAIAD